MPKDTDYRLRLPAKLAAPMRALATINRRPMSGEVMLAIENHLAAKHDKKKSK